jgi:hypothetical protein
MGTLALLLAAASAQAAPLPEFMTGCWSLVEGDHWTQECWMEPKGGLMLGASREGNGAKLKSWEQMRVEQSAAGKLTLFASPHGRAAVPFEGRILSPNAVEFANATHDYPQRIRYELKDGRLDAEISLIDGSQAVRWSYVREKP